MSNKIFNKQLSMKTVEKLSNYLEDIKDEYSKKFQIEETENRNIPYAERNYEYEYGSVSIKYTIGFQNGQDITQSEYNWFVNNLRNAKSIKHMTIEFYLRYQTKSVEQSINNVNNNIYISLWFRENDINLTIDTENQESESNRIYRDIIGMIEENEDRYNKTIKYRKIRIQSFTISIGIILSYILYAVLKSNYDILPEIFQSYLVNKNILLYGQWFIAIVFGNMLSYWFILGIYRPLLPGYRPAGYNKSTFKTNYVDDIEDFRENSEVHFGKYYDAGRRRNVIEKIYKITKWIVLVQLAISFMVF